MNSDDRIARLERLTKLFVRAGRRERQHRKTLEEKIDIIIDFQNANEERFARNEERFAKFDERFAKLTETVTHLAEAQTRTEKRLDSLIAVIEQDRNGHSA